MMRKSRLRPIRLTALREVEMGNQEEARAGAIKLAPNRDVQAMAALALTRAGDTAGPDRTWRGQQLRHTRPDLCARRNLPRPGRWETSATHQADPVFSLEVFCAKESNCSKFRNDGLKVEVQRFSS